jgi:KaiC/GvpD/RAD55 family RecA-like ATPase
MVQNQSGFKQNSSGNTDFSDNLEKFGVHFQETLGYLILYDNLFADQILEVLKYEYITVRHVRETVRIIYEHREKYNYYPTWDFLGTLIAINSERWNETEQNVIGDYYFRLEDPIPYQEIEPTKEMSLRFCKNEALKIALLNVVDRMKKGDIEDADKIISEALLLGSNNDLGMEPFKSVDSLFEVDFRRPIPIGIRTLDDLFAGGLGRGELGIIAGKSNSGKTTTLVNFANNAVMNGYNVVYYTLEISDILLSQRFCTALSGIPTRDLKDNKEDVKELAAHVEGKLLVKQYPTSSASFLTIRNHLEKVRRTMFKPDLVVIDYPEIMAFPEGQEDWKGIITLYRKIRGMAKELDVAIWVASQLNKGGYQSEELDMEQMAGALGKNDVSDIILGFKRSRKDEAENRATLFILKSRVSAKGHIYRMTYNASTICIDIHERSDQEAITDQEAERADSDARQKAAIHKALEKVKKKGIMKDL